MDENTIAALAREYAEEEAKGTAVDALPNGLKENVIQRNADHFEKHLRWLLRRFCLVEKSKVENIYKGILVQQDPKNFGYSAYNQGKKELLESLFPNSQEVEG